MMVEAVSVDASANANANPQEVETLPPFEGGQEVGVNESYEETEDPKGPPAPQRHHARQTETQRAIGTVTRTVKKLPRRSWLVVLDLVRYEIASELGEGE